MIDWCDNLLGLFDMSRLVLALVPVLVLFGAINTIRTFPISRNSRCRTYISLTSRRGRSSSIRSFRLYLCSLVKSSLDCYIWCSICGEIRTKIRYIQRRSKLRNGSYCFLPSWISSLLCWAISPSIWWTALFGRFQEEVTSSRLPFCPVASWRELSVLLRFLAASWPFSVSQACRSLLWFLIQAVELARSQQRWSASCFYWLQLPSIAVDWCIKNGFSTSMRWVLWRWSSSRDCTASSSWFLLRLASNIYPVLGIATLNAFRLIAATTWKISTNFGMKSWAALFYSISTWA